MDSRVSGSLLAHTRAVPSRKNRRSHADRVEEATWTLITPGRWPQGQETVPGTSVFSVFLLYSASIAQTTLRQVHTHKDLLGGSVPDVVPQL